MLAKNAQAETYERLWGLPLINVGPITKEAVLPATGPAKVALLFVDFPNGPASGSAAGSASNFTAYTDWFAEASYGRFSLNVTPVDTWFRMPRPGSEYRVYTIDGLNAYMRDVVAAADAGVDFSRYDAIWVVASPSGGLLGNTAFARFPGRGVQADGAEVRFAAIFGSPRYPGLYQSAVMLHEHLHAMGLPDLGLAGKQLGSWDPMYATDQGSSTAHLLAWHKWLLGWLDPTQLTCQHGSGQLEETLTAVASPGGKKLVVVPTSASTAYAVEVRTRVGYDRTLCQDGVLIYTLDSQVNNGNGPVEGKSATSRCAPETTPLSVGEAFEDSAIKVEVLAADGRAYRVRVTKK